MEPASQAEPAQLPSSASGREIPSRDATSRRVTSPKEKGRRASQKEEKDQLHRGGKGKKSGKADSSFASKANIAEEEVEEEAEDDALLTDKRRKRRHPPPKKKGKSQPASSPAHEAEAVDEDGFAYSAISLPPDMVSFNNEWCLKGAKESQGKEDEGTVMILDTGCTKAMRNRHAYHYMKHCLSDGQVELLPDSSTFSSQVVKEPWPARSAESGSLMNHLCSQTSPLSMRERFPVSRPFRR